MRKLMGASVLALAAGLAPALAEDVKIGMITTLSGGGAGLGTDVRDGFELALDRAGEDAGVELVVEDDAQKPELAVQIADKMIQSEGVDILTGIIFSNLAMAVIPSATAQGVFYVSPNAGPSQLAGAGCHPDYFNASWQNDGPHEAMGAYAKAQGYDNVFLLAPNYPAGQDALTGFKRLYDGGIAGEALSQFGATDYAAEIAQIRASGADALYIFLPGGMGIAFMKQFAQSGVDMPVLGAAFSFDQTQLPAIGEAALGARNGSQWSKDLDNEANREFVAAFEEKYGRLPSVYASQGYDTANLILSAMEKADVSDRDAFRDALMEADFDAVRGNFRFGPNHHPIQDFYVREVVMEDGVLTNKMVEKVLTDHQDAYAADCKM